MVFILISTVFLLPVFMGLGRLTEFCLGKFSNGISGLTLSGIFTAAVLFSCISFFCSLNIIVELLVVSLGLGSFFYDKLYLKTWNLFKYNFSGNFLLFLPVIIAGSFLPFILDHFGYYIPTIQWIAEFGLVKGIANLDLLLGQMSVWHIFQAGFSNFSDPYLRMNTVILLIYILYVIENKKWIHLLFVPFLLLFAQSPSPDLPVIIFAMIILNEIFSENKNWKLLLAFSVIIFAIKPTMIWLPLFLFLVIIFNNRQHLGKSLALSGLIFLLFFVKNLWCFGYPVFPLAVADLGVPWEPNPALMEISAQTAVLKTFDMQYTLEQIQNFTWKDYVYNWLFLKGIKSKIHLLFIASLIIFLIYSAAKRNQLITLLCISVLIKSILVLIFSAQYRFFIDVFFVVVFVLCYEKLSRKFLLCTYVAASIFFLAFLSFPTKVKKFIPSFKLSQFMLGPQKMQWYEPAYFQWKKYTSHQIGNLKFNVVADYPFSFDVPLPAISPEFLKEDLEAGIFPQKNSEKLQKGFHWKKMTPQQKKEVQKILNNFMTEDSYK